LVLEFFNPAEDLAKIEGSVDIKLIESLMDDLNTSMALTRIREMYRLVKSGGLPIGTFITSLRFIGLRNLNRPGFFHPGFDANLYRSGPQIDRKLEKNVVRFRNAAANGHDEIKDQLASALWAAGLVVQLNEAGVLFVGNRTSAGMVDLEAELKEKVAGLISERTTARARKDFKESDRIRDQLAAMGVIIKDSKEGTTWEIAR